MEENREKVYYFLERIKLYWIQLDLKAKRNDSVIATLKIIFKEGNKISNLDRKFVMLDVFKMCCENIFQSWTDFLIISF